MLLGEGSMKKVNFVIISRDTYLKNELKSLLSANEYYTHWFDNTLSALKKPDIMMQSQYVLIDDFLYGLPDSFFEKTPHISYIFIEDDYNLKIIDHPNCRSINREKLISVLQKYKFGILFDKELVA